jgi:hypothetical protein
MAREGWVHNPTVVLTSEGVDEGPGVTVIDVAAVYEDAGVGYSTDDIEAMAQALRDSGFAATADELAGWWTEREAPSEIGYVFQQVDPDPMSHQPWPVVVSHDGEVVHGRPDAARLLGFVLPDGAGSRLDFSLNLVLEDHVPVLGLYPVFMGADGGFFSISVPVKSFEPYTGDMDALRRATAELVQTITPTPERAAAIALLDSLVAGDMDAASGAGR